MVLLLLPTATGCLQGAEDEPDPFAVVTISGEVFEHGEERHPHACGRPLWSAGLSEENRRLTILEDHAPSGQLRLALWDTVAEVNAGNWSACEWPVASLLTTDQATWTLDHNFLERSFPVERTGERLAVDGTNLSAGENRTVHVDERPAGTDYTYRGRLTFTFHGVWPAKSLETVDSEEDIVGVEGTVERSP